MSIPSSIPAAPIPRLGRARAARKREGERAERGELERLRSGDRSVVERLVDEHWEALVLYGRRLLGPAEGSVRGADLAQEAFLRLWDRRDRWHEPFEPRALLHRIVRNLALNGVSRRRRAAELQARHPGRTFSPPATPEEVLRSRSVERRFVAALDALSERRRQVFLLARFENLTYEEIAAELGLSRQTVANHMSAALRELRHTMGDVRGG